MPETHKNIADYPWEIEGWPAREKAVGPLEWEQECCTGLPQEPTTITRYRLCRANVGWSRRVWSVRLETWVWNAHLTDHEAASLIREHQRVWLFEKRVWLIPEACGYMVQRFKHGRFEYLTEDGKWSTDDDDGKLFDTYDTAQAAAIDAVIREKESTDEN